MDSERIAQTVVVAGDWVSRVEFGPGEWGFAIVGCGRRIWVVPLLRVDGAITLAVDSRSGDARRLDAHVSPVGNSFGPQEPLWRSETVVSVRVNEADRWVDAELDLVSGDVLSPLEQPDELAPSNGLRTHLLASAPSAPGTYYQRVDGSCHGEPGVVPVPLVLTENGERRVATGDTEAFSGIRQMIFGRAGQVAWVTECNGTASVWTAVADAENGGFSSIARAVDDAWLDGAGWYSLVHHVAFLEDSRLVIWGVSNAGLESATLTRDGSAEMQISEPTLVLAVDPAEPRRVASPLQVRSAQSVDVDPASLSSFWPAGTAERDGLVFYALGSYPAEEGVVACDQASSPIYAYGASPTPELVARAPGARVSTFYVDWSGRLVSVSECETTTYLMVAEFDAASRTIVDGSIIVRKRTMPQSQPHERVDGNVAWGPYVLDVDRVGWTIKQLPVETFRDKATPIRAGTDTSRRPAFSAMRDCHRILRFN